MKIKVLIVDDHLVVLRGLRFFLQTQPGIDIVGQALNGLEALQMVEQLKPEVVLMDIRMPVMDGIEATKRITEHFPDVKVIILTSFSDQDLVLPALKAGAAAYQLKDVKPEVLSETIKAAIDGNRTLHPEVTNQLVSHVTFEPAAESDISILTAKEREVLELITEGRSNKEIAQQLLIAEKTVKTHVTHIFAKINVQDRTQAALHAMKHNWFR
ncbi:response regulator [Marinicrinis lubricantis]|uniref:Response regulator n=1 Tax=Marinicrinis lubricantis TaxID=2086470 RepID=A0ABW1IK30_9BACL